MKIIWIGRFRVWLPSCFVGIVHLSGYLADEPFEGADPSADASLIFGSSDESEEESDEDEDSSDEDEEDEDSEDEGVCQANSKQSSQITHLALIVLHKRSFLSSTNEVLLGLVNAIS